jgi:hypothetical protein
MYLTSLHDSNQYIKTIVLYIIAVIVCIVSPPKLYVEALTFYANAFGDMEVRGQYILNELIRLGPNPIGLVYLKRRKIYGRDIPFIPCPNKCTEERPC